MDEVTIIKYILQSQYYNDSSYGDVDNNWCHLTLMKDWTSSRAGAGAASMNCLSFCNSIITCWQHVVALTQRNQRQAFRSTCNFIINNRSAFS